MQDRLWQAAKTRFARSSASPGFVARLPEFSSRLRRAVVVWIRSVLKVPPAYMPEVDFLESEHETILAIDSLGPDVSAVKPTRMDQASRRVVQPPCINSFLKKATSASVAILWLFIYRGTTPERK